MGQAAVHRRHELIHVSVCLSASACVRRRQLVEDELDEEDDALDELDEEDVEAAGVELDDEVLEVEPLEDEDVLGEEEPERESVR